MEANSILPSNKVSKDISVIVPAHNAVDHLDECVMSILGQPCVGEVIVVDDGSTDATASVGEFLASKDNRIVFIHKENGGVSSARNVGLSCASLPFICFVDSDDVLPFGALGALRLAAENNRADMSYGLYGILKGNRVVDSHERFPGIADGPISVRDALSSLISCTSASISGSCWRILYRTAFLRDNSISFPEGIRMGEDLFFILDCYLAHPKICCTSEIVYLLRREGGSATQRYMPKLEQDMDVVNSKLLECCQKSRVPLDGFYECASNTAWYACGTLYKEGSPFGRTSRKCQIRRIMRKYSAEVKCLRLTGTMPKAKLFLLKIGRAFPFLLWIVLEVRNARFMGGRIVHGA